MSNRKIEKLAQAEGFCCLWAFFRAHEKTSTSDLRKLLERGCTKRALQQQRARYRDEQYHCEENEKCLRRKHQR
jgi:hypothetical protein